MNAAPVTPSAPSVNGSIVGPGNPPKEFRYDTESAKRAAQASLESKRRDKEELERLRKLAEKFGQVIPPVPKKTPAEREANSVWQELKALRAEMGKATTAAEKRDLSNAYSRLFAAWQVLTGTPNPGARRVGKTSGARQSGELLAGPVPQSTPQQVVYTPFWSQLNVPLST